MITKDQVVAIIPGVAHLDEYFGPLITGMYQYKIDSPARMGAYLSQIGHESNKFKALKEYASGAEYEGRASLGNTEPGDGIKFKGRGAIQITGRNNYKAVSRALYGDLRLLEHPELLEAPEAAFLASAWWWEDHGLNIYADKPESWVHPGKHQYSKFQWITIMVNGGLNGFDERLRFYNNARHVLGF
jgi:putative chitinase